MSTETKVSLPPSEALPERGRALIRDQVIERAAAAAPMFLRLSLGVVMAAHGAQKLTGIRQAAAGFEQLGFSPGTLWAPLVGATELLAGTALIVGLLTRLASFGLFVVQVVALVAVHLPNGFFLNWTLDPADGYHGIEFNLVNIGGLLALIFLGSGKAGVDEALRRRRGQVAPKSTGATQSSA